MGYLRVKTPNGRVLKDSIEGLNYYQDSTVSRLSSLNPRKARWRCSLWTTISHWHWQSIDVTHGHVHITAVTQYMQHDNCKCKSCWKSLALRAWQCYYALHNLSFLVADQISLLIRLEILLGSTEYNTTTTTMIIFSLQDAGFRISFYITAFSFLTLNKLT